MPTICAINQLKAAGITDVPFDDLSWLGHAPPRHNPPRPYILFVPGASAHRPEKRWPAARYAALAKLLAGEGYATVILGDKGEAATADAISTLIPDIIDLTGQTDLADLADLARDAAAAVGNDTGPMHLIGATGCRTIVLFSGKSDPVHSVPKGDEIIFIQDIEINNINENNVLKYILTSVK